MKATRSTDELPHLPGLPAPPVTITLTLSQEEANRLYYITAFCDDFPRMAAEVQKNVTGGIPNYERLYKFMNCTHQALNEAGACWNHRIFE